MDDERYFAQFKEDPPEAFGNALYEQLMPADETSLSPNGYHPEETIPLKPLTQRGRGQGVVMALVASVATALLLGAFILNHTNRPSAKSGLRS